MAEPIEMQFGGTIAGAQPYIIWGTYEWQLANIIEQCVIGSNAGYRYQLFAQAYGTGVTWEISQIECFMRKSLGNGYLHPTNCCLSA